MADAADAFRVPKRRQNAVYWACMGRDNHGQPVYADPVDLKVRWEDDIVQMKDQGPEDIGTRDHGQRVLYDAHVYLGEDVVVDSVLWQGTIATLTDTEDPLANEGAFTVKRFAKTPTARGTKYLREAYL